MTTVLAHGTFDLLHPGHVAHLEQAKAMGDYLIVGVTADRYVTKGSGRPVVPAQDRAYAVQALRCVDEVVIDLHPTPEYLITTRRPDIFVKGADYANRTIPEQEWVARYGGTVAFTSGATMYHSRQWINGDVREQMEAAGLRVQDLLAILDSAVAHRIHVVGDLIVDEHVRGELIGPLTLLAGKSERWVGGAGAVALHAAGAGAQVSLVVARSTNDGVGSWAVLAVDAGGVDIRLVPISQTPHKTRYYDQDRLLWQVDHVDNTPLGPPQVAKVATWVHEIPADAVIFADYRHGMFHRDSIKTLRAAIPRDALTVADSQVASRWGNILDFHDFDLVTPNEREARWATGAQENSPTILAETLLREGSFRQILMTRAESGLLGTTGYGTAFTVPALAQNVVDPVGAGDALLAYATLGLLSRNSLVAAAWLGSIAAAIACSRRGNAPVTAAEVRQWLEAL